MTKQVKFFPSVACVGILLGISSFAQTPARRQTNSVSEIQGPSASLGANANSMDQVANEIAQLRKSLQTLNTRLREITEKVLAPDTADSNADNKQVNISRNLGLLTQVEQRAEMLRKQLLELIERETALKSRLVQIDEDSRPENIERTLNVIGTTRTVELREARRRILENERRGVENLLNQTTQSRIRLEEDVRQADAMVAKLRQRLLPLIDREIEKINPN
jgi:uncharacterized protein YoxC